MKNRSLSLIACLAAVCMAEEPRITLHQSGGSRSLNPSFAGQNGNLIRGGNWHDEGLLAAFRSLNAGHLRYPAGTIANYWNWKTGWFLEGDPLPHGWPAIEPNPHTLEDLKTGCGEQTVPIFVLNMLTSDLDDQMAMLREAKRIGLPVRYVELGNEYYLEKTDYTARYPHGADYAREANRWAAAIKKEFPDAKVCAVGAATRNNDSERRLAWNGQVFPLLEKIDAVSLHIYSGSGLSVSKNELYEATGLVQAAGIQVQKDGMWGDSAAQVAQALKFLGPAGVRDMLSMPFARMRSMNDLEYLPDGMEVWVTEYNLFDRTGPVRCTWAHGLFSAAMTLNFLDDPRISFATHHSVYDNPAFCAIFKDETALDKLVRIPEMPPVPAPQPNGLSASGFSLQLIGHAMTGMTSATRLGFSINPEISTRMSGSYPSLTGWVFGNGTESRVLILNLSETGFIIGSEGVLRVRQYAAADPRSYIGSRQDLSSMDTVPSGEVSLGPWSLTLLDIQADGVIPEGGADERISKQHTGGAMNISTKTAAVHLLTAGLAAAQQDGSVWQRLQDLKLTSVFAGGASAEVFEEEGRPVLQVLSGTAGGGTVAWIKDQKPASSQGSVYRSVDFRIDQPGEGPGFTVAFAEAASAVKNSVNIAEYRKTVLVELSAINIGGVVQLFVRRTDGQENQSGWSGSTWVSENIRPAIRLEPGEVYRAELRFDSEEAMIHFRLSEPASGRELIGGRFAAGEIGITAPGERSFRFLAGEPFNNAAKGWNFSLLDINVTGVR